MLQAIWLGIMLSVFIAVWLDITLFQFDPIWLACDILDTLNHWLYPTIQPWEDRYLVAEVYQVRPFEQPSGAEAVQAWDEVEKGIQKASLGNPYAVDLRHSGGACKARMSHLEKKTGTNEEVDEYMWLLSEIVAMIDADKIQDTSLFKQTKYKAALEKQAGEELQDASMEGLICRESLTDITASNDATTWEKQAQRKCSHSLSENVPLGSQQSRSSKFVRLEEAIQQHTKNDEQCLAEAHDIEAQRYEEIYTLLQDGFGTLSQILIKYEDQHHQDQQYQEEVH
ncbi:hypothetical protein C8Q75DRAFT_737354 [Abortiporus biennis]|nr:hypothetical protein C8Q75DRAFT_737354 [Abortiporus biennis]